VAIACQSFGEFSRVNSRWHCPLLEGGFDPQDRFIHIPLGSQPEMGESSAISALS
jgi:hypothetical protein